MGESCDGAMTAQSGSSRQCPDGTPCSRFPRTTTDFARPTAVVDINGARAETGYCGKGAEFWVLGYIAER